MTLDSRINTIHYQSWSRLFRPALLVEPQLGLGPFYLLASLDFNSTFSSHRSHNKTNHRIFGEKRQICKWHSQKTLHSHVIWDHLISSQGVCRGPGFCYCIQYWAAAIVSSGCVMYMWHPCEGRLQVQRCKTLLHKTQALSDGKVIFCLVELYLKHVDELPIMWTQSTHSTVLCQCCINWHFNATFAVWKERFSDIKQRSHNSALCNIMVSYASTMHCVTVAMQLNAY